MAVFRDITFLAAGPQVNAGVSPSKPHNGMSAMPLIDLLVLLRNVLLPVTALSTLVVLFRRPKLWWLCLAVWATAIALVVYLPLRVASYTPKSFDDVGGGFEIWFDWMCFSATVGPIHIVLFVFLLLAATAPPQLTRGLG